MGLRDFLKKAKADPRSVEQRIADRKLKAKRAKDAERAEKAAVVAEARRKRDAEAAVKEADRREKQVVREQARTPLRKPAVFFEVITRHWHETPNMPMPYAGARQISITEANKCPIGSNARLTGEAAEYYSQAKEVKLYVVLRNGGIWTPTVTAKELLEIPQLRTADWKKAQKAA